jgi:glutathione-independent formaldehyde dehydrogenase
MKLEPNGVDRACDCLGDESVDAEGTNVGQIVINRAIAVTRTGGGLWSYWGLYHR